MIKTSHPPQVDIAYVAIPYFTCDMNVPDKSKNWPMDRVSIYGVSFNIT